MSPEVYVVREETPTDLASIREMNRQAFNGYAEAELVDRLWTSGAVLVPLVAVAEGRSSATSSSAIFPSTPDRRSLTPPRLRRWP